MKKLAYLILAHEDPIHLSKLVKSLDYNSDFYIHIDKKSNIDDFKSHIQQDNVIFIKNRVPVYWADISMIDAEINLLDAALKHSYLYSHAVFLSGSCFPIKKKEYIYEFFTSQPKKEFLKFIDMRDSPEHYLKHIKFKWFRSPFIVSNNIYIQKIDKLIRYIVTKLKLKNDWDDKIIPYFGSQWIALTMECSKYVRDYHFSKNDFREMNKYTFSPDEHYIHTIVGNSKFSKNSDGKMVFQGSGNWRLANFHIIHPLLGKKWYTLDDWNEIVNSDKLFVRKLNTKKSSDLVDKIISELL